LIGTLTLHRTEPHEWSAEEVGLTETVAREIGLAIHVARLLRDNERRIAQQAAFFRIAAMLGQSLSLAETLDALGQAATDAFGGDAAAVLMPRGSDLELAASVQLPDGLARALAPALPPSAESLASAAADERILVSPAVVRDDRLEPPWQSLFQGGGLSPLLAGPGASLRARRPRPGVGC